jgi:hypothetical protein
VRIVRSATIVSRLGGRSRLREDPILSYAICIAEFTADTALYTLIADIVIGPTTSNQL